MDTNRCAYTKQHILKQSIDHAHGMDVQNPLARTKIGMCPGWGVGSLLRPRKHALKDFDVLRLIAGVVRDLT